MPNYYRYFGLERDPFLDTADPYFYCELGVYRRARERLTASVGASRGLAVVLGEPGSGKTSLSVALEQELLQNDRIALGKIVDPAYASESEFLVAVARVFGMSLPPRSGAVLRNAIKNYLFETAIVESRTPVLIVDEAQNLAEESFDALRALLNYEVPQRKLLNVLLFGQNELERRIGQRQNLADRVDGWLRLDPLDEGAAGTVLDYRLSRAGARPDRPLFTPGARALLLGNAAGLPRRLIAIAHLAMEEAVDRACTLVDEDHVRSALSLRGIAPRTPTRALFSRFFSRRVPS